MKRHVFVLAAIAATLALSLTAVQADTVGSAHFDGLVDHVSSNNIKVINPKTHESLSFLLVPHFKQIFSGDGKTTVQMADLRKGDFVKVYYDQ